MDITDAAQVSEVITKVSPDVVIHCAAWTAVDAAEDDDKVDSLAVILNIEPVTNVKTFAINWKWLIVKSISNHKRDKLLWEVYNVGGHNEKRNIDIVKLICKELGKPESLIVHVGDRKGHDMRYAIDPTKIHNELGWLPETKFEDGIKKTIQWYLDNKEWWETIISGEYQNYYEKMYSNR